MGPNVVDSNDIKTFRSYVSDTKIYRQDDCVPCYGFSYDSLVAFLCKCGNDHDPFMIVCRRRRQDAVAVCAAVSTFQQWPLGVWSISGRFPSR